MTCIDCGHPCTPTAYRCRKCQCRETRNHHLIIDKEIEMAYLKSINPTLGDIGEEQEEIELEPVEVPTTVPAEPVPA